MRSSETSVRKKATFSRNVPATTALPCGTYENKHRTEALSGTSPLSLSTLIVPERGRKIDRINFIKQFGWEVAAEPVKEQQVLIPKEFDKVYAAYNELQKEQGLNLTKYKGKDVTRYTFSVTNYKGYEGTVYANVLVYRNRVIGGDICSADVSGFLHGFEG